MDYDFDSAFKALIIVGALGGASIVGLIWLVVSLIN